jgi:16S rRNA (guanine(966)-N(2))-methyltransferase RsmD
MRVIRGEAGGRKLKSPRGVPIRPMMERVRGALFDSLEAQGELGERVLDLYAGTGAVGIEALSRGANAADFVESHPLCCRTIRENLRTTGLEDRGRVFRRRVEQVLGRPQLLALPSGETPSYDLVSITPPYANTDIVEVTRLLAGSGLLRAGSVVVVEHPRRFEMPERIDRLSRFWYRRYGSTAVSFYRRTENEETQTT